MSLIKKFKPVTPGIRFRTILKNKRLIKNKLEKKLIKKLNRTGGRNNKGRITVRHRGGGHKKQYRNVLFKRKKFKGSVCSFEYDPNRTAFLAKIFSFDTKEYLYVLAPKGLVVGDEITYDSSLDSGRVSIGDSTALKNIPVGSLIHNIELTPGNGGQLARAAGNFAQLIEKNSNKARIRLRSGEQRFVALSCFGCFGVIDNEEHCRVNKGKAGSYRWLGKRPHVRGVAMNPVDHPHGGGQGKTSGGRPSVTPKGLPTKGQPTRKKKFSQNILISVRALKILKKKSTRKGKFSY